MKKQKIIFVTLIMALLVMSACSNNIDAKNEEILTRLLELEEIDVNKVSIDKDTIFVSIEVSSADEYDTQIIAWWGTIFGYSAVLQGDYIAVIIENTVNKEPYAYISTNVYTIRDFEDSIITDAEFWDETLITSSKPRTRDVIRASGLPTEALTDEQTKIRTNTILIITLILIVIILAILTVILLKKKKSKKQKVETHHAPKKRKHKETIKKIKDKVKQKTKKLKEKTKEKTKSFKEKMKQEPGR